VEESNEPFKEVVDVTYRPCLAAIASYGEGLAR
jgi:hypothetical protein